MTANDWLALAGALLILAAPPFAAAVVWLLLPPSAPPCLLRHAADGLAVLFATMTIVALLALWR